MAELLSGKAVAEGVLPQLAEEAGKLIAAGVQPKLAILRVGKRPDDLFYEKGAKKTLGQAQIACETTELPEDVDDATFQATLDKLNADPGVHGILIFQPLPKQIDSRAARHRIDPRKDIDGMSPVNMAKVFEGDRSGFAPCTPTAVMEILKFYNVELSGKRAVVLGRSTVVGKPAAMLLLNENATVTICHSRTKDLPGVAREADILVAAIGKAKMVTADYIKPGAVVIDVGINLDENGKYCGDVDTEAAAAVASRITPVPGGVGSVTTTVLARHVLRAAHDLR